MTLLQYPGKKNTLARWIVDHFPNDYQSMTYLEPFFGTGCVFFTKERSLLETINDRDGEITNLFTQIRERPQELIDLLQNTPWSRDEYDIAYMETDNALEKARRCFVRFWFTVGANVRTKNGMRFEIDGMTGGINYFHQKLPEAIRIATERLKHSSRCLVQIENKDALLLIEKYNRENVLMYLDPPYLLDTRKRKKIYRHEYSDNEHEELLKKIIVSKAKIIISGYMSDLYSEYLYGWNVDCKKSTDQAGNRKTEYIWRNFRKEQGTLFEGREL
jgi:DNA adenine methylase